MAKIAQLVEGNYNILDNIPVINQDLTASGFTPVANTYYRHTGATTDTFTQGVIYLYDTAYHKLGESGGGGTTLNKYTLTLDLTKTVTEASNTRFRTIISSAKGRVMGTIVVNGSSYCLYPGTDGSSELHGTYVMMKENNYFVIHNYVVSVYPNTFNVGYDKMLSNTNGESYLRSNANPTGSSITYLKVTYYNDTEIT